MSAVSRTAGPLHHFGAGNMRKEGAALVLEQQIGPALVDHRGVIEMAAYASAAEGISSGVYWHSFTEPIGTVQAWLALTAGAPARLGDTLRLASDLAHRDDAQATATLSVSNGAGEVICTGIARDVRVGRTSEALAALDKDDLQSTFPAAPPPRLDVTAPAPIDPGWDGGRILLALSRGELPPGPLTELLAMTVRVTEAGPVCAMTPQEWMANPYGAIQGGIIASAVAHACALAGQGHTGPGDGYRLADFSVHFFRSPQIDVGPLTVSTGTERVGRRLATVSATLTDGAGTEYARAVADIAYTRA
ncbi:MULTISPECIES: acyl-CoA thioesterase domain-containing protein [Mycolicibacterium]|uniref:acyl-CoA thioesterase domain-containing protein n=1 Tax=Mycolicibacterium hassiacum TaxID=46351 RepID=UPI000363875B|nr:thioesterase [Mycolicibacterium hassiacum DSM 44199]